ncbi:ABC transporter permease [Roseovarius aestuarii]|nr:ABC transporter permease [Roseovarius aestuarii]
MLILQLAVKRLMSSIPTLLILLVGLFLLLQLAPGDTVDALIAQLGGGSAETAEELRRYYGLDGSTMARLLDYLWRLVRLDLGFSAIYDKPVATVIFERLPVTLLLMVLSLSFAFIMGMLLGIISARKVNGWLDTILSLLGMVFYATPAFWLGLMSIVIFSIRLGWLPPGGYYDILAGNTGLAHVWDVTRHMLQPTVTLALIYMAIYLRIMRASMLEVSTLDFVRTARAKGLSRNQIIRHHILRNALLPMITIMGLQAGAILGGSVVIESVFSLPGIGKLAYESVIQRDLNMLLGIVFVSALMVIVVNFVVDLIYAYLDPRITSEKV